MTILFIALFQRHLAKMASRYRRNSRSPSHFCEVEISFLRHGKAIQDGKARKPFHFQRGAKHKRSNSSTEWLHISVMKLLSLRAVRSTVDAEARRKVPVADVRNESEVVLEETGFAIEALQRKKNIRAANLIDNELDHQLAFQRNRSEKTKNLRVRTSSDEYSHRRRRAKVIFSDLEDSDSMDSYMEEWLEKVYTSQESTIEVRKEVSRVVLQCLMSSTDDDTKKASPGTDRYTVAYPQESSNDDDGCDVPPSVAAAAEAAATFATPVSPMTEVMSTRSAAASISLSLEAAREMEYERQRIRAEIVKSMSIATNDDDDLTPGLEHIAEDTPTSSVESFLLMMGFSCFVPKVPLSPEHPFPKGSRTISWMDSISLSTLSY
jgi:hypothetical protein